MKTIKLAFITLFLLSQHYGWAQKDNSDTSKATEFSSKAGTLIQREFVPVGNFKAAKVQVLRVRDMLSHEAVSAVRIELEVSGSYGSNTKIASLDADEIDDLIKSIKFMQENILTSSPSNYTEVTYRSRGGFEAGCYWYNDSWKTYLQLQQNDSKSYIVLKPEEFSQLIAVLEDAKAALR